LHKVITSLQNPVFKELLQLQEKSRERKATGLFVAEGRREVEHCIEGGFTIRTLFVCPEICSYAPDAGCPVVELPLALYRKAAYREGTEGIIAEVEYKSRSLEDLALPENPLIVVLESVEKPGNLGAVLRSADAAGVDAVILCDPLTDLYNPNVIRASLGAIFTVPTIAAPSGEVIKWLKDRKIQILTAQLQDSSLYYKADMTCGTAIVMGTESTGLTQEWRNAADAHILIPMLGKVDSLNVSVSAAVLIFEAVRQRKASV